MRKRLSLLGASALLPFTALAQTADPRPAPTAITPVTRPLPDRRNGPVDDGDGIPHTRSRAPVFLPAPPDARIVARPPAPATPLSTLSTLSTLREAITAAYAGNPQLLAQRASLRGTDNLVAQARAAYGPQVDLEASHSYLATRRDIAPGRSLTDSGFSSTAALIFAQPIFSSGRNRASEGSARAQVALGRDQLRLAEASVLLNVVQAYVGVIRDTELVAIADENLRLLERQLVENSERYRVREITVADLQQIETRVGLGRAQLLAAQGELGASRALFLSTIGAPPGTLADPELLTVPVESLADAQRIADADSALIRAAQSREKISRAGIEFAEADAGPRVDLRSTGAYGPSLPYANSLRTRDLRAEAVLTMPLIDSGLRRARTRQAREANQSDWRLIDQAVRDTREAVATSWERFTAARASLDDYRTAIEAARLAYEGAVLQQRAGLRTTLDVLDLARDLLTVRTNFVTVRANEFASRAGLLAAMGALEAPLLVPGLPAYDPRDHYARVARGGDIPLLTPTLSALDGIGVGDLTTDRPVRDPAASVALPATVPLVARPRAAVP